MSFREDVLAELHMLNSLSVSNIAGQLDRIIRGQTTRKKFKVNGDGERKLVEEVVTVTPRDAAAGMMVADTLLGGELGLAPRLGGHSKGAAELYDRYLPEQGGSLVWGEKKKDSRDTVPVIAPVADSDADQAESEG
ncbi:MAG: hypothetical protein CMK74_20270 [Pseudomonadales bacterium]|nr:hypothetical protein [Pseudomonadales bacterium]|tara:strand:- start:916 stop:1323 length:408 start_codon:yes stop_codon:yes gene_type:complete